MKCLKVFNHKFILGCCNLMFSACGVILLLSGIYLVTDGPRLLLSRLLGFGSHRLSELAQPFFYYIALSLSGAGMIAIFASIIGWWALCINTYCILTIYFLIVLLLLVLEFGACLIITLWPQCLGLNLNETTMVKSLQGNYGIPGKEELTAAMDLAQTYFKCCAINSNINYDTSMWRLQSFGLRDWTVPLTCCHLSNINDENAYLDPQPLNLTLCQSLEIETYQTSRHMEGCLEKIDFWYRQQYVVFLAICLILVIVEFFVLLSIIFNCTKISRTNQRIEFDTNHHHHQQHQQQQQLHQQQKHLGLMIGSGNDRSNIYQSNENIYAEHSLQNVSTVSGEIKERYVQSPVQPDLFPIKHLVKSNRSSTTSTPSKYQYHISKSYLV